MNCATTVTTAIEFNREFQFRYGTVERLTPLVRRVVARNPGAFTFHGTATFIVGNREVAVIDPGPDLPDHTAAIVAAVKGERVTHIVATHTHADHSPGCRPLQEKTGAPVCGFGRHRDAAGHGDGQRDSADRDFAPDIKLADGDVVAGLDWHLRAVHTPGHCANHLCFALPEENTLFCGDQVMAWATTAVVPPDGDVGDYIKSLEKLKRRPETIYRPTHGAEIKNPHAFIDLVLAHRRRRVEEVHAALNDGVTDIADIRARIYTGLADDLHRAAELSILASLIFLIQHHRAAADPSPTVSAKFYAT